MKERCQIKKKQKKNATYIERKAMIRNRYNYRTPSIEDTKGKEENHRHTNKEELQQRSRHGMVSRKTTCRLGLNHLKTCFEI